MDGGDAVGSRDEVSVPCSDCSVRQADLTVSSISLVCAADTQKRALDSMIGVAGNPTTTVPMFLFTISLPNALQHTQTLLSHAHNGLCVGVCG